MLIDSASSLDGDLAHFGVLDVIHFVQRRGHSGHFRAECPPSQVKLDFREGNLVGGWRSGSDPLGVRLVNLGVVDDLAIDEALLTQADERPRRPLGKILFSMGCVSMEDLARVVEEQIREALNTAISFRSGTFSFLVADLRSIDYIALCPNIDLDTEEVLFEAVRLQHELERFLED